MFALDLQDHPISDDMARIFRSRNSWDELRGSTFYVSGATGMLASYFVLFLIYLNERMGFGITVHIGVRNAQKAYARFGEYASKPYFHLCVADASEPLPADLRADYWVHAASLASPQFYGTCPVETMLPNVVGTYQFLEHIRKTGCRSALFISSGSVYGTLLNIDAITEDMAGVLRFLEPGNCYGESKRCGEALCRAYCQEYAVPVKTARVHHTYGPGMDYENDRRVFAEFVKNIVHSENIMMKSDGGAKRTFCYIADTLSGMFRVLLNGAAGEPYNIANTDAYVNVRELAECLTALYPEKRLRVDMQTRTGDNYCPSPEQRVIPTSCDKLRALGWEPTFGIAEGFRRTIDYLLKKEQAAVPRS